MQNSSCTRAGAVFYYSASLTEPLEALLLCTTAAGRCRQAGSRLASPQRREGGRWRRPLGLASAGRREAGGRGRAPSSAAPAAGPRERLHPLPEEEGSRGEPGRSRSPAASPGDGSGRAPPVRSGRWPGAGRAPLWYGREGGGQSPERLRLSGVRVPGAPLRRRRGGTAAPRPLPPRHCPAAPLSLSRRPLSPP